MALLSLEKTKTKKKNRPMHATDLPCKIVLPVSVLHYFELSQHLGVITAQMCPLPLGWSIKEA